jgi:hypothetical protein
MSDVTTLSLPPEALSALIAVAQEAVLAERAAGVPAIEPIYGDFVVAMEGCPMVDGLPDPDMIGWFIAHGAVPFLGDARKPREIWDIRPLSGQTSSGKWLHKFHKGKITNRELAWWSDVPYLRWEGATFVRVTAPVDRLIRAMHEKKPGKNS